jgi:hypothetical protein
MTDKLNRWLTLTANIGVVIGLVLLFVELQQNTEMMRAQITHSRSETAQSENQAVFNSDHIPGVISKVRSGIKLSEEDLIRYEFYFRAFNRNQDNVLWQYREGFLSENVPDSIRAAVKSEVGASALSRDLWKRSKSAYSREYVTFVDEVLGDSP